MSDIVERLRAGEPCSIEGGDRCKVLDAASGCLCATAADTITALRSALLDAEKESKYSFFEAHLDQMGDANRHLRAEVERLRAALWEIIGMDEVAIVDWKKGDGWLHQKVARAALKEDSNE